MARKITDEDLANRGVMGLPDVPGLTAIEMQKKLEEITREVIIPRYNELVDSVADICDEFSKLNSYAVGDYCIYQNKLYKCNTATSGDWDASKWTETSVGDELKSVNSNLLKLLWSNENPNNTFAPQTIVLGTDDFDYLDIYISDNSSQIVSVTCHRVLKNTTQQASVCYVRTSNYGLIVQRPITSSMNSVEFGNVILVSTNSDVPITNNDYMIPLYIYGGKFA